MKVALVNFSGNVGKTTISRHLLLPRLGNGQYFPVETINSDGSDTAGTRGKDFMSTLIQMMLADGAVVDIGSSNVEAVFHVMKQNPGAHEDFDFFVVPAVPSMKQQRDTMSTVDALASLGVSAKKIRVLFNQVEPGDDPENVFSGLFAYHGAENKFTLRPDAVMFQNPLFPKLASSTVSISEILADDTDFKAKIAEAQDSEEKLRYAQLLALRRGASGVAGELDKVFKTLFK